MSQPVNAPSVSVVIPTRDRPTLLLERALRSALAQTLEDIEIIVVVDGPDPATQAALATVDDPRLRVIALPQRLGGAEARNVGVRAARAAWIALLDDDDEWLPRKLEWQLALARAAPGRPIVACHWITRTPHGDAANPPRLPAPHEPLGDYLLARRTALQRTAGLVSTLLLTSRELLLDVPFTPGLPRHQDWDWLLRAAALPEVHLAFVPETAAIWYYEEARASVSTRRNWRTSLAWARQHLARGTMSRRAFAGFLNSHLAPIAQQAGDRDAALTLLPALLAARPRPFEVLRFAANFAVSTEARRQGRARLEGQVRRLRNRAAPRPQPPYLPSLSAGGPWHRRAAESQVNMHSSRPSRPPIPSPRSIQSVALIAPLTGGHHGGYASTLARELTDRGIRVQIIGPAPLVAEVCRAVPQVSGHVLPLFPGSAAEYYRLGRVSRERLNLRFLGAALRLAGAAGADTAHLLWLDSFVLPLLAARLGLALELVLRPGRRMPAVRGTLHWAYFLRAFREGGGGGSEVAHRLLLRALGALGTRVMMHSGQLVARVGTGNLDAVPHPALAPQIAAPQRAAVRQAVRDRLQIPSGATVLLAFGGTRRDKGSDLALEALARLPAQYHLLVVGPTRAFDAGALRDLAERLAVTERLHLLLEHVPDEDVEGYFLASDAALLPYRRTFAGQSGPLLIAASLGLPVLAADVGVLAEVTSAYHLGALFTPEDPAALARCVLEFDPAAFWPETARFQQEHTPSTFADAVLQSYAAGTSPLTSAASAPGRRPG